jgi:hypothetical protein
VQHESCLTWSSLLLLALAGCAAAPHAAPVAHAPPVHEPPATAAAAPVAAVETATPPSNAATASAPNPAASTAPALPAKPAPPAGVVKARPQAPAKAAVPSAAPAMAAKQTTQEQRPAAPTLDLTALEQRLRDTHAIGLFTKLSLKNQVDDLLDEFRAHHRGQANPPLTALRQRYDLLLMKVLTLLQDGDPPLASAINSSREAIWSLLNDPAKLTAI